MKIEQIDLANIRQFVGNQTIRLSTDASRSVTLIHGPNTAGKTTLLNAIHWCLYGTFLSGFLEPQRLRSDECANGEYGVTVYFVHRQRRYIARRTSSGDPNDSTLVVLEQRVSGEAVPHPSPEVLIQTMLPEALAPHFFFAGEMIRNGLSTGGYQRTATDAIRAVLGLKLAELAIEDLNWIRKSKSKGLQELSRGTDLAAVTEKIEKAEEFVESRVSQLSSSRELIGQLESEKRRLFDVLRDVESSSKLQRRRDSAQAELEIANKQLVRALSNRQEFVPKFGSSVFLRECAAGAVSFIDMAVTKRRIPSPFDKTFVQDILSSETCVCGRCVRPGTPEYREVASLLNSATDETVLRRAMAVRAIAERIASGVESAGKEAERCLQQLFAAQERVETLETELARVKELLQRHEQQNVREHEKQLDGVEKTLRELLTRKVMTEADIETKRQELVQLRAERERAKSATPAIEIARSALDTIDLLLDGLKAELLRVEQRGIARISEVLNVLVGSSTRQKYTAEVTTDYQIQLFRTDDTGETKPVRVLSSGESRLLDLCFVSALVCVCKERESETDAILSPGAVAPMVVDAPFGELDPEYQALAARTMMELSEQLVLMLSKTHWTTEVDEAVRPFVGAEYLMIGYRQGRPVDAKPVEILISGKSYQQMVFNSNRNWTELHRIGG